MTYCCDIEIVIIPSFKGKEHSNESFSFLFLMIIKLLRPHIDSKYIATRNCTNVFILNK